MPRPAFLCRGRGHLGTVFTIEGGTINECNAHIIPTSELRQDASGIVKRAASSGDPVFITQHGRASAVLVSAGRDQGPRAD
jgi:prevent-host-death family protein